MKISYTKWLFLIFFIGSLNCFSQKTSPQFSEILNSDSLSVDEKDHAFYRLIEAHKLNNEISFLIHDTFEITRWQWVQQMNWEGKIIALCKKNVDVMDSLKMNSTSFYRRNLYALGYYQFYSYKLDDALLTYKTLLTQNEKDNYVLRGAHDIAEIYFVRDQYYSARDYFKLSMAIAERQNNIIYEIKSALGIAQANKLINSPQSLNNGIKVLSDIIKKAEDIYRNPSSNITIDLLFFHQMYIQLGNLYIDRIDYDFENGKKYLGKALDIAREINDPELLNKVYNDLGVLYRKDKKKEAKFYLEKALLYDSGADMESLVHRNLSKHHLYFKNYDKALYHIQNSLATLVNIDSSNFKSLPSKSDLVSSEAKFQIILCLMDKANIWIELSEDKPNTKEFRDDIFNTLELADFLADQIRLENIDNRSKLFWRKKASEIYRKATKASYLFGEHDNAFYFMEKNKALLLLEDISLKSIKTNANIPSTITNQESELKNEITRLQGLTPKNNTDSLQSQLLLAKDNYKKFINSLNPEVKLYFKTLEPAKVIDLNIFKKDFLNHTKAYIEYIIPEEDDEEGYGLIITSEESKLFEIKDCKALKELTIEYRSLIDTPFKNKESVAHFKTVANTLHDLLLPKEIKTLIKGKTLTVVPDYYLQNIPFEALTSSTKKLDYLLYTNEINYAYSLTFLSENKKNKKVNKNDIIAIAPVEFPKELLSLPYTKEELRFIDRTFNANLLVNDEASKSNFFNKSNNFNIIHIASHANANDSISPWIAFYDQKASLNEIYTLNNSAELVVLSACNTSLGKIHHGEGVMSLSRGFFNSGSQSVMPTLWEVNDKSTLTLVKSFYNNLNQNQDKSLALHNAKLEYLKNNSLSNASPYYWASFVLIGDTSPIEFSNRYFTYYYIILAIFILSIIWLFIKKIKK